MRKASGFTLVELLIVMAIIAVIAAIGMAGWRNARVRGNETTALASLTAINQAQFGFAHTCGGGRFAPTFAALGTPMPATGQAFLSADLTQSDPIVKGGYRFTMAGTEDPDNKPSCTGALGLLQTYQVTAEPTHPGVTGLRFFGTNTDRVVYSDSVTFAGQMPEAGAPGHGAEIK
jgi:type IV pilus assembly protein PilA